MSTVVDPNPHSLAECRAKDSSTCPYHGNPLGHAIDSETDLDAALDDLMQEPEPELVYQPQRSFPSAYLPQAEMIIDRANRRLERAGIAERFTYTTETFVREVDGEDIEYTNFCWNAPSISLNGWSFVAAHEFTPGGQATSHYITEDAIRDTREISARCEHCGATRHRQRVYWVRNEEGEIKQIGSSCLQAFLGVKPQGLWAIGDDLHIGDDDETRMTHMTRGSVVYPSDRLVAAALKVSDDDGGFVSRNAAGATRRATADTVTAGWRSGLRGTVEDKTYAARAQELLTWARNLPADGDSQYLRNLHVAASEENVKAKHVALVVSLIGAYERDQERARVQAARAAARAAAPQRQQAYYAEVGEKVVGVPATIRMRRYFSNDFGGMTMFIMDTDDGYTFKWNASNAPEGYNAGDRIRIQTGSVKSQQNRDGEYQTVLQRVKFAEEAPAQHA